MNPQHQHGWIAQLVEQRKPREEDTMKERVLPHREQQRVHHQEQRHPRVEAGTIHPEAQRGERRRADAKKRIEHRIAIKAAHDESGQ